MNGQTKERLFHVEAHLVVVERHDPIQAAPGALLDSRVVRLRSLADDLHNVVALAFVLKVCAHKLQRVAQGGDGSVPHVVVGLLFPCTLDDGGENCVGIRRKAAAKLQVVRLADVADCPQRRLLLVFLTLADILHQLRHQLGPEVLGQLDGRYRGHELRGGLACS